MHVQIPEVIVFRSLGFCQDRHPSARCAHGCFSVWDFGNLHGPRHSGTVSGAKGADPCLKIYPNALEVCLIG